MKPRIHLILCLLTASLPLAAAGPLSLRAAPPVPDAKPEPPPALSTFAIPASTAEGRDPFFPDSTRVYVGNPKNQSHGPVLTGLALKSIMGAPPHVFAIINNHTFAVGEDGDVITESGERLHILCSDINLKAGTVTVEAGGMRTVLHLTGGL